MGTQYTIRYIAPEQLPVQFGGLSREGEQEFATAEPATEEIIKPACKHTIEIPVTEVRNSLFFVMYKLAKPKLDNLFVSIKLICFCIYRHAYQFGRLKLLDGMYVMELNLYLLRDTQSSYRSQERWD